jgi:hypothetical protein
MERAPNTHWLGGWVGPRVGLDAAKKGKILHCWESNLSHPFSIFNILIQQHFKSSVLDIKKRTFSSRALF